MIVFEDVSLKKGGKVIIDNMSTVIDDSDKVLIFARNGSGKSSLIKCIAGLEQVERGGIKYCKSGKEVIRGEMVISYLPEFYELDKNISVKNLYNGFYLANKVNGSLTDKSFIDKIFEALMIKKLENQHFNTLSKGEKKRLLMAITMMVKYDCLILDEPYDGLDSEWRKTISELLKSSLNQMSAPATIIISSHIYNEKTDLICNKVMTIENKKVEVKAS